jgi:hypothetical protein
VRSTPTRNSFILSPSVSPTSSTLATSPANGGKQGFSRGFWRAVRACACAWGRRPPSSDRPRPQCLRISESSIGSPPVDATSGPSP